MATIDLHFSTEPGTPSTALVSGPSLTPGIKPTFVAGDTYDVRVFLHNRGGVDAASGAGSYSIKLALGTPGAVPTGGTFTLSDGTATSALAYNASASDVQTALNALNTGAGPYSGTVTVTRPVVGLYLIKWDATGSRSALTGDAAGLTPTSGIVITEEQAGDGSTKEWQSVRLAQSPVVLQDTWTPITSPYAGWQAKFAVNTYDMLALLLAGTSSISMELELTDPDGDKRTIYRDTVSLLTEVIDNAAFTPQPQASYYTATETRSRFIMNRSEITGLTGGGSTNLDGITTASGAVSAGTLVAVNVGNTLYHYELVSGTDAESSPNVIRPDDYASTTNEYVWKIRTSRTLFAEGVGAGTAYSFTNSYARITYGTTSLQASLPEAGTYDVTAVLEIVNGATANDVYTAKFYDATNAADISNSERKNDNLAASKTGQMMLKNQITTTGAANIQIYGVNATAARGTSTSTRSTIAWVKIG
jgi:hypothetical protein